MEFYEYIAIHGLDDEPTKEDVMKAIAEEDWTSFRCLKMILADVAKRILEKKHNDWEMWDEDEYVYLIVRKYGTEEWELHKATIQYVMCIDTEQIYLDDDEK